MPNSGHMSLSQNGCMEDRKEITENDRTWVVLKKKILRLTFPFPINMTGHIGRKDSKEMFLQIQNLLGNHYLEVVIWVMVITN